LDSYDFLNRFSLSLRGRKLPRVPYPLMKFLAVTGDAAKAIGFKVPFRSDRLGRMMAAHGARYESLWDEFGYKPVSHGEAVEQTKLWLEQNFPKIYS
jgi:hypothetical protein